MSSAFCVTADHSLCTTPVVPPDDIYRRVAESLAVAATEVTARRKFLVTAATPSVNVSGRLGRCRSWRRTWPGGGPMEDSADRFLELIHELEDLCSSVTAQRALAEFDETTLQVFWKKWPHVSAWAGSLWSMLSAELAVPSSMQRDAELDETGESG
jgi:hypothetical protein